MTTIYDNNEAFGLMSPEKQEAMRAHKGRFISYIDSGGWTEISGPYYHSLVYRAVRPAEKPMTVEPEVWRVLHPDLRWITRDEDGRIDGWTGRPELGSAAWSPGWGIIKLTAVFAPGLIDPGTCDWTQAIVERPEGGDA